MMRRVTLGLVLVTCNHLAIVCGCASRGMRRERPRATRGPRTNITKRHAAGDRKRTSSSNECGTKPSSAMLPLQRVQHGPPGLCQDLCQDLTMSAWSFSNEVHLFAGTAKRCAILKPESKAVNLVTGAGESCSDRSSCNEIKNLYEAKAGMH